MTKHYEKDGCIFCELPKDRIICENNLAIAFYDLFPVSDKHTLIIPRRHIKDFFELTEDELIACDELINKLKKTLLIDDSLISGFNIGINCGEDAGQTVFHCHIHLIPRRKGDVDNPQGGVRHVIPTKGNYTSLSEN